MRARIPARRVSLPKLPDVPAEARRILEEDNARVRARAGSVRESDRMRPRLQGVGLWMALEPRPVAPVLAWRAERLSDWLDRVRRLGRSENEGTIVAIVVALVVAAVAWKYGN